MMAGWLIEAPRNFERKSPSVPGAAAELLHRSDNLSQLVVEVVGEDEVDGLDLAEVLSVGQRVRVWKIRQVHRGGGLQKTTREEML